MPTEIKMWNIDNNNVPRAVASEKLDLEYRLEEWIQTDPELVSSEFIIIGKQVKTEYGGFIDLLALDQDGNLVVLELKRDKTPRDIVAQILDYGSWVEQLDSEQIQEIAEDYLGSQSLEAAFSEKFQVEALPEVLNERHRMFIVASQLDAASERIVKYLSESYNVDINVVTFSFFKTSSGELLCRSFLLDELQVTGRAKRRSKRQPPKTWEEIEKLAIEKNILPLYKKALTELGTFFKSATQTLFGVTFSGYTGEPARLKAIIGLRLEMSSEELGLTIKIFWDRLCEYLGCAEHDVREIIGTPYTKDQLKYHFKEDKLERLIDFIRLRKANTQVEKESSQ
jgi:hypothetical protein